MIYLEQVMEVVNNGLVTQLAGTIPARPDLAREGNIIHPGHPRRQQVEAFIKRRFLEVHAAQITQFMPCLLALFDAQGKVMAAVGIREADSEVLFLEHYFDIPVEHAIASCSTEIMLPPVRASIVEIGNLASINRKASCRLFALLTEYLERRSLDWAVFTGCSSLQRMFETLGIKTVALGRALQSRLPADQQTWGGYYEDNPMVVAGRVSCGRDAFVNPGVACGLEEAS